MVSFSDFNLFNAFGGKDKSASDAAAPYFEQAQRTMKKYAKPFINRGEEQYGGLNDIYMQMRDDPAAFLESIMGNYEPSARYQQALKHGTQAASAAAAAGGYRGAPEDQEMQGRLAQSLMSDDMQNYINNILGIQTQGLGGSQGFYNQGYQAATGLGSDLSNLYSSQGSLAVNDYRQNAQQKQDLQNALLQGALMAFF